MASEGLIDAWDPLHSASPPGAFWSTSNFGEAMPGVMTPLGWTFWGPTAERATRGAFARMGALTRSEAVYPDDPRDRVCTAFYGRVAGQVNFLVSMGDRLPGTTGAAVAEQVVGAMPEELTSQPTRRRYPVIAVRFPYTFATIGRRVRRAASDTELWWSTSVHAVSSMSREEAVRQLAEAHRRFDRNVALQGVHVLCAVQPVYDQLAKLVSAGGGGDVTAFMSGYGSHSEAATVNDMWAASRGLLAIEEVVRRHGYHGPHEGEISGRVWREDATALQKLLEGYKTLDDAADPALVQAAKRAERRELERMLISSLPPRRRPGAHLVLRLAATVIPLRGVGKAAFLQSLDMGRAAARRIGEMLASEGDLRDPDDIFFLTLDEVMAPPGNAQELVAKRRERDLHYKTLQLPAAWLGQPCPVTQTSNDEGLSDALIEGVGASPGIVEGLVRVVTDSDDDTFEPGEILVTPTTDPSWASIMFMSKALVVDIGGVLSHAAIVARELAVPCVVNTKVGSQRLRTGDLVRVDGGTGRIEILERHQP